MESAHPNLWRIEEQICCLPYGFKPPQVGLHVPNCELFGGKFGYKEFSLVGLYTRLNTPHPTGRPRSRRAVPYCVDSSRVRLSTMPFTMRPINDRKAEIAPAIAVRTMPRTKSSSLGKTETEKINANIRPTTPKTRMPNIHMAALRRAVWWSTTF